MFGGFSVPVFDQRHICCTSLSETDAECLNPGLSKNFEALRSLIYSERFEITGLRKNKKNRWETPFLVDAAVQEVCVFAIKYDLLWIFINCATFLISFIPLFALVERDNSNEVYETLLSDNERAAVANLLQFLESNHSFHHFNNLYLINYYLDRSDAVILSGEPLQALTTLSYSSNVDLQRSAALAFAEITERRVDEVDAAVLEPLLFLLRESTDVEVQRASSAALGNLAVNVANKLKIVRLGGLESLIRQMNSSNVEVQCNAVGCITNLATHEENKGAIARSGALIPLTRLARTTKDIRVQRNATGALLNMTHSEDNRRQLVDAGAIPVLVTLLRSPDPDVVYYCTTALSNLAVDSGNRKKLSHEARLVNELIDLMENRSTKIQCQSILAIRNLASDELYQLEIARHPRGLSRILLALTGQKSDLGIESQQSNNPNVKSLIPPHTQIVLACVACIRNISIHPQNETKIIDSGFLKPLVNLLGSENEEIQCHAVSTLRNLAASSSMVVETDGSPSPIFNNENKDRIIQSGALEKIQSFLINVLNKVERKENVSWSVVSEMTACLAVLALSDKIKPRLLDIGVVGTLLAYVAPNIPVEVQGNAAAALGNLATKGN